MFDRDIYIGRREKLKNQVGSGCILLFGNGESPMNYADNCYPFRQDSSFLYFYGLDRADLAAFIDIDNGGETVFGDDITVEDMVWTGPLERLADAATRAGVEQVRPLRHLGAAVTEASKKRKLHYLPPYRDYNRQRLSLWLDMPLDMINKSASAVLISAVIAQRSVKSEEEIREIGKAVNITVDMQCRAALLAREGVSETAIAGVLHGLALSAGGDLSFPSIVTVNGEILHNHAKGNILNKGQMLLCDCGAETAMHYAGDLTRTFPVGEAFTERQKLVYEVVGHAHDAAIAALKPGVLFRDVHLLACRQLAEGLKDMGLMKGDLDEAVLVGAHALFFQCGLGHMMGLDTHDMEDLGEENVGYTDTLKKSHVFGLKSLRLARALEPGFVLTVEPGLYFNGGLIDRWKAEKRFEAFIAYKEVEKFREFGGIRIEEDFVITADGSQVLGQPLPTTPSGVERLKKGLR